MPKDAVSPVVEGNWNPAWGIWMPDCPHCFNPVAHGPRAVPAVGSAVAKDARRQSEAGPFVIKCPHCQKEFRHTVGRGPGGAE